MNLTQALGVIFGSNIGTTIGWIISIKVGKYGLLLIGLGIFPARLQIKDGSKSVEYFWNRSNFYRLETMSAALQPLRTNQAFLDSISF